MFPRETIFCLLAVLGVLTACQGDGDSAVPKESDDGGIEIYDSERSKEPFLSPEEARRTIQAPPGFSVSLFAAEPDIRQPIAMAFDGRGRLWVAENYTYAEASFSQELPCWIGSHVKAFNYFGCVPEVVVPDNLKSADYTPGRSWPWP